MNALNRLPAPLDGSVAAPAGAAVLVLRLVRAIALHSGKAVAAVFELRVLGPRLHGPHLCDAQRSLRRGRRGDGAREVRCDLNSL